MTPLDRVVADLRTRIVRYLGSRRLNEQDSKATLIEPVLRALGWDLEDLDEVRREYKMKPQDRPVDYALLPRLLIEAKGLGEDVADRRWANQIMGYAAVAGAEWVVLTNGDEYRIFNAHAAVSVDEKLFRTIRVTDVASYPAETLELLRKDRMAENRLQSLWKAYFIDRKVRAALGEVFSPAPDPGLVRLLHKRTKELKPEEVRRSLSRVVVQFDFPVEPVPVGDAPKGVSSHRTDVSPADLVRAGLIAPPLALTRTYKGTALEARIEPDGTVTCLGKSYASLSTAAGMARATVIGIPRGRKYPQTNGWTFWQFRDTDGDLKEIDALRRRFLAKARLRRVGGEASAG
jgi:hypothetical protein